ncbi:hypothetical protein A9K71_21045 [Mesorhizobium sp. WSM3873]|nr:hypothetical protein A9K71_21045 [Mesorhizobium sp. WSM3873]
MNGQHGYRTEDMQKSRRKRLRKPCEGIRLVRWRTKRSRVRKIIDRAYCSSVLTATKRIVVWRPLP